MKKLLLLLLCVPLIGLGQLSVDINNGYLNLREKPDDRSRVVKKLDNNEELGYAGEWNGPWIKVVKSMGSQEKGIIGWVHKDYVSSSNFKSRFLGNVDDVLEDEDVGAGCYMSGVEGTIMANNIINLQGRKTILKINETENFSVYYNNKILIKLFTLTSIEHEIYGNIGSYCLAIINYNGKEEVIFVKFMCGC